VRSDLAAWRLQRAARRYFEFLRKANFNPNQPRVPVGDPDGGQWTDSGGGIGSATDVSASRRRLTVGRGTPAQEARLTLARTRAENAARALRGLDPNWQPTQSLTAPRSVEGEISRFKAEAAEADARLDILNRLGIEPLSPNTETEARPMDEILMPGGREIGYVAPGVEKNIRTVSVGEFQNIRNQLMTGAQPIPTPRNVKGLWFERLDGTRFALRWSAEHGPTVDVIRSNSLLLEAGYKVHRK